MPVPSPLGEGKDEGGCPGPSALVARRNARLWRGVGREIQNAVAIKLEGSIDLLQFDEFDRGVGLIDAAGAKENGVNSRSAELAGVASKGTP